VLSLGEKVKVLSLKRKKLYPEAAKICNKTKSSTYELVKVCDKYLVGKKHSICVMHVQNMKKCSIHRVQYYL
jgi:hypothetical protein